MQNKAKGACASASPSFNRGCEIAADQQRTGVVRRPKIRDVRGRFAPKPMPRQATKPIKPQ
jgi:hypothetical protein